MSNLIFMSIEHEYNLKSAKKDLDAINLNIYIFIYFKIRLNHHCCPSVLEMACMFVYYVHIIM